MQTRLCKVSFKAQLKKVHRKNTNKFTEKYKKCHQVMQTRRVSFQARLKKFTEKYKKVHREIQKSTKKSYIDNLLDHFATLVGQFWSDLVTAVWFHAVLFLFLVFALTSCRRWSAGGPSPKHRWQCLIDSTLKVNSAKGLQQNTQSLIKMMYL